MEDHISNLEEIDRKIRKSLKGSENWPTLLRERMSQLGLIGDRYVYGLAAFEPETVGLVGNCGDIIRWKDPMDPDRKLRQYMFLLNQIKPGLFVALHVQALPPVDGLNSRHTGFLTQPLRRNARHAF